MPRQYLQSIENFSKQVNKFYSQRENMKYKKHRKGNSTKIYKKIRAIKLKNVQ